MPSVTGALKNLRTRGLVNYEKNSYISLTETGMKLAKGVEQKHRFLASFLEEILLLPSERAQAEACEIEHVVSPDTTERLKRLTLFLQEKFSEKDGYNPERWRSIILSNPGE